MPVDPKELMEVGRKYANLFIEQREQKLAAILGDQGGWETAGQVGGGLLSAGLTARNLAEVAPTFQNSGLLRTRGGKAGLAQMLATPLAGAAGWGHALSEADREDGSLLRGAGKLLGTGIVGSLGAGAGAHVGSMVGKGGVGSLVGAGLGGLAGILGADKMWGHSPEKKASITGESGDWEQTGRGLGALLALPGSAMEVSTAHREMNAPQSIRTFPGPQSLAGNRGNLMRRQGKTRLATALLTPLVGASSWGHALAEADRENGSIVKGLGKGMGTGLLGSTGVAAGTALGSRFGLGGALAGGAVGGLAGVLGADKRWGTEPGQ